MLIFPQLSTGALVQYPIRKTRLERTILNISEDGRSTAFSDSFAKVIHWDLSYRGLTDAEVLSLVSFYEACEGPLQSFLFFDVSENLLSYSEDYTQPVWVLNSLVAMESGIDDPFGTARASRLTNTSGGNLTITQTAGVPGIINTAFSAYLRAKGPLNGVGLARTDGSTNTFVPLQPSTSWTRFSLNTAFASSISMTSDFSIAIPPGASLDLFGLQVDAQPFPGKYVTSVAETGVFPSARFDSNKVNVIATDVGQSSIKLSICSKASA